MLYVFIILFSFLTLQIFSEIKAPKLKPKWFIGLKKNNNNFNDLFSFENYVVLKPPKLKYYADPMLFKYKGINYIFFEESDYKKGIILYVTVNDDMTFSQPKLALELPCHVSFPYVFEDNNKIYMIPETSKIKSINLYEAIDFPHNWKKISTLIKGGIGLGDSVMIKHEDYYYLIFIKNYLYLRIYYSKDLLSEFRPHPINLKKFYVSRNAGNIVSINGRLIRPVMDCSKVYGGSIIINEILLLTPTDFEEKEICRIKPDNIRTELTRTHTFCINEDYIVFDAARDINSLEDDLYSS